MYKDDLAASASVPWSEVNRYLHQHGCWGEPVPYQDDDHLCLPWIQTSDVEFDVGDTTYKWSREDSDTSDDRWHTHLRWTHSIVGELELVLRVGSGRYELLTEDDTYNMHDGRLDQIPLDLQLAVKSALTDFYLWFNDKPAQPGGFDKNAIATNDAAAGVLSGDSA